MGNTTESGLPLHTLANIALLAGLDMGFNAAGAERWIDPDTFEPRLSITWGSSEWMKRPRLRTPCEWALSYDDDAICQRAPRTYEFPVSIGFESAEAMRSRFIEKLLELADA